MNTLFGYPDMNTLLEDFYKWVSKNSRYTKKDLYLNNQLTDKYIGRFKKWLKNHPYQA